MGRWILKIKLISDLCTATGEDAPGITNIMTATEDGVPCIPARRIKGCLLESGREMRDNGFIAPALLEGIFGRTGVQQSEGICIGDAHISFVPAYLFGEETEGSIDIIDDKIFQTEVHKCTDSEKAFLEEFFTRQRTRTAINAESGTAEKHSLRTMQVVPRGIEFISCIEGDLSQKEEEALLNCAKGLRHMGMGITRGFGEVRCTLEAASGEGSEYRSISERTLKNEELLQKYHQEEEMELSYEITLDSPIAIDGEDDCLPAGPVLGALAGMYIKKFVQGKGTEAHEDERFRRIFLHDGVQFGYGYLKRNDRVYYPCPKAIAETKAEKGKWFQIVGDEENRRRKEIQKQVYWEGNELHTISARKEIHFHHSRPLNRGIAHALNDRAEDTGTPAGQFFQYTALSKEQTYAGAWIGKAEDIRCLTECLHENGFRMKLGRSKTVEYGKCTFEITGVSLKNCKQDTPCGKSWLLWLLTPMLLRNVKTGEYTLDDNVFRKQLEEKLGFEIKNFKMAAGGYTTHSGYNSKWRMPLVSCPALAAGSTFMIETDKEVCQHEIEGIRWGELVGRGYGQIKVRLFQKEEGDIINDSEENCRERSREESEKCKLGQILDFCSKRLENREKALSKVGEISGADLPPSSAIAVLSQLLRSYAGDKDFYQKIENEVNGIQDKEKRERILNFIKPCKGNDASYEFMKLYLENAKWKARQRGKDEY